MKKIIVAAVLLVAIAAAAIVLPYGFDKAGIFQKNNSITFEITSDDSANGISHRLRQEKIIKSARIYRNYLDKHYPDFEYTQGVFELNSNMSFKQLVNAFTNPVVEIEKIVIPEGKDLFGIADILEANEICSKEDFFAAVQDTDKYNYTFIDEINPDGKAYLLEGYLFPATYEFTKGMDATKVIDTMLLAFTWRLSDSMVQEMKKQDLSLDALITLASIVQAEAIPSEMSKVASVFINRLNSGDFSKLQSDPTVFYANKLKEEGFSESIYKGYTTYTANGIPAGAICSPGTDAMQAVLYPSETNYYYFISDSDGVFHYANTYAEHEENCRVAGLL